MPVRTLSCPDRIRAVALLLVGLLIAAVASVTVSGDARAVPAPYAGPAVGLLGPSAAQAAALTGSGVRRMMVSAGWDSLQPQPTVYNTVAAAALVARVTGLQQQGFDVVLDMGLQYPPAWVFSLPGQTRFVNQYGEAWTGTGLSTAIPNVVFNPAVRLAEADYIAYLGRLLGGAGVKAVRVGGMLTAELRYPPASTNGHVDAMWFYDPVAQAGAPVPGWRPGTGTPAQTAASVDYYFGALNGYLAWQMRSVALAFPGGEQQVLLPSWGLRPGQLTAAVATTMSSATPTNVLWAIGSGLDWDHQVQVIAASGIPGATVYCTWIDAPSYGDSPTGMSPLRYLAGLAATYGLPLAGENTGKGGVAALQTSLTNAAALRLTSVMYMSGRFIDDCSAGVTLKQFRQMATTFAADASKAAPPTSPTGSPSFGSTGS